MAETFPILELQKFKTMSDKRGLEFSLSAKIQKKSAELNAANKLTKIVVFNQQMVDTIFRSVGTTNILQKRESHVSLYKT